MRWQICAGLLMALGVPACSRPAPPPAPPSQPATKSATQPPDFEPPPGTEKWVWTSTSRDARVSLVQTASAPNNCEIRCLRDPGQQEVWKAASCLGTRESVRLVSDDGERILVIDPAPALEGNWRAAAVATAYMRGEPKAQLLASDLFSTDAKLMVFPDSLQWLSGGRKVPVPAPKFVEGSPDRVELQLIDGRKAIVLLDGTLVEGARPADKSTSLGKGKAKAKAKAKLHR